MKDLKVIITLDIDMNNSYGKKLKDYYIDKFLKDFCLLLANYSIQKATWFIRIDNNIEFNWGECDYIYKYLANRIKALGNKHEFGWHPHSYIYKSGKWQQNTEINTILIELKNIMPIVKSLNISSIRMGWGFQSNEIMNFIAENGFLVDSSAIPRPQYLWEETYKDWSITPSHPYYPSKEDYRIPGTPAHSILEVPMSVTTIKAPYDTEDIARYINLAYDPKILKPSLERWISENSFLVTITHPYEIIPHETKHELISFSIKSFEENLNNIIQISNDLGKEVSFLTISEFANQFIQEKSNE